MVEVERINTVYLREIGLIKISGKRKMDVNNQIS